MVEANHQALDPKRTLAILVGVQKYDDPDFINIEPALKNVAEFKKVLLDDSIFGIPEHNIHELINGKDVEIEDELEKLTKAAKKSGISTILFFFTGHGYKRTDKKYYLATTNSRKSRINRSGKSAIAFEELESIFRESQIRQSIIILDACFSGIIAQGEDDVIEAKPWRGSYRLTSSHATEKSYFTPKADHTVFTGELLRIFREGSEVDREKLSLEELYLLLKEAVFAKNPDMVPQQRPSEEIAASKYQFFRNKQFNHESKFVRESQEEIFDYLEDIFAGKKRKSQNGLRRLKREVTDLLESTAQAEPLIRIDAEIDFCLRIGKEMPKLETVIRNKNADEINELKQKLKSSEKEFVALVNKHEGAERELLVSKRKAIDSTKTIHELRAEIEQLKSRIEELSSPEPENNTTQDFSDLIGKESTNMIFIEGGTFQMGSAEDDSESYDNEKPQHEVSLSDFYLAKYPVTQGLWRAVMGSDPEKSYFKGCGNCPVEGVSWTDAEEFLKKLNSQTNKSYRLPSETEWEYAARGGVESKGYKYAGSNDPKKVAWYDENSDEKTHQVGDLASNELGLHDMSGNVWEWCQDWYDDYPAGPQIDPQGPENGNPRVVRGGSWSGAAQYCRVASRRHVPPGSRLSLVGFRLAHSL